MTTYCSSPGCGQEIRFGWREGPNREDWWHRENVDHNAKLGQLVTPEMAAEYERQRDLPRIRIDDKTGEEIVYTAREYDLARMSKAARDRAAEEAADDDEEIQPLEPIEIHTIPLPHKGRLFVGCPDGTVAQAAVPGGVRTLINAGSKSGWRVRRLTYSRGPYLGAKGSLGVSDMVVLVMEGPVLDSERTLAIGSWRDGGSDWAWLVRGSKTDRIGAKALRDFIKENPVTQIEQAS